MEIITKTDLDNVIFDIKVPNIYNLNSDVSINEALIEEDNHNYIRLLHTNGLIVLDVSTTFETNINNILSFENNLIALIFHFHGQTIVKSDSEHKKLQEQVHNIEVINTENVHILFEKKSLTDTFIILLNKDFYFKLIPSKNPIHSHLFEALENNYNMSLSVDYLPINQEMKRVIDNVRHCTRKGAFHRFCLELKITELLMLQLEQFHLFISNKKEKTQPNIDDQKKLDKVKKILDASYYNPPTIKELSSTVGMNESKLKADFKNSFDKTIHSYTLKLRMDTAYTLITESEKPIKDVAITVGYQNASHFSAAFKKFFGFNPSKI